MIVLCTSCNRQCTVDEESATSTSCPSCGRVLNFVLPVDKSSAVHSQAETQKFDPSGSLGGAEVEILPRSVGRYTLESLLGTGGFARVYRATDQQFKGTVAIKVPRAEVYNDPQVVLALLAEARNASRLQFPGIVRIYDSGYLPDDLPFISMEFVAGESLKQRLERQRLTVSQSVALVASLCDAIHHAHRQGVVHRDLKPANVLIDPQGRPKISDFGLSLHENEQKLLHGGDSSGTPAYMAPEQVRGESHRMDGRTDIWSVGVILYELLCGRRPFQGFPRQRLFDEILTRDPRPPRQIDDAIPPDIEAICLRCLAKPVTERYHTALDVAEGLRRWLRENSNSLSPAPRPAALVSLEETHRPELTPLAAIPAAQRPTGRNMWLAGGVATLVLFLAGVWLAAAGVFSSRGDSDEDRSPPDAAVSKQGASPELVPGRFYSLLDREPRPLIWTQAADDSFRSYDSKKAQFVVGSSYEGLFRVAETKSLSFVLETQFTKSNWIGESGIFWGGQESREPSGVRVVRLQALYLRGFLDGQQITHRLVRESLIFRDTPGEETPVPHGATLAAKTVAPPRHDEGRLRIRIAGAVLTEVRWNEAEIPELVDGPHLPVLQPLIAEGHFGLYNKNGATVFQDLRAKLWDSSVPETKQDQ